MELLIVQLFQTFCYFLFLRSKYSPQHPFPQSQILNLIGQNRTSSPVLCLLFIAENTGLMKKKKRQLHS